MASTWIPSSRDLPRSFWIVWFGTLVNRAGAFVGPFLALYLVGERGMHIERVGEIIALVGLGSLAAGPLGGALADRVGVEGPSRRPVCSVRPRYSPSVPRANRAPSLQAHFR